MQAYTGLQTGDRLKPFALPLSLAAFFFMMPRSAEASDFQSRLAAMRARHGKAPAQDPRITVGFHAEDQAAMRAWNTSKAKEVSGSWVLYEDLKEGDAVLLDGLRCRVAQIYNGYAYVDWKGKGRYDSFVNRLLGPAINWKNRKGPTGLRRIPSASEGGMGQKGGVLKSGRLVYRIGETGEFDRQVAALARQKAANKAAEARAQEASRQERLQTARRYNAKLVASSTGLSAPPFPARNHPGQWVPVRSLKRADVILVGAQKTPYATFAPVFHKGTQGRDGQVAFEGAPHPYFDRYSLKLFHFGVKLTKDPFVRAVNRAYLNYSHGNLFSAKNMADSVRVGSLPGSDALEYWVFRVDPTSALAAQARASVAAFDRYEQASKDFVARYHKKKAENLAAREKQEQERRQRCANLRHDYKFCNEDHLGPARVYGSGYTPSSSGSTGTYRPPTTSTRPTGPCGGLPCHSSEYEQRDRINNPTKYFQNRY